MNIRIIPLNGYVLEWMSDHQLMTEDDGSILIFPTRRKAREKCDWWLREGCEGLTVRKLSASAFIDKP